MSLVIYTYRDPYRLKDNKALWNEISTCPFFCVTQTLVNGLKRVYGREFQRDRVTTIKKLIDAIYQDWNSTDYIVKQHAAIDTVIARLNKVNNLTSEQLNNIKKSFVFNRKEVFQSIRTMFELKINPDKIIDKYLTLEQRFIVEVYKKILSSEKVKDFYLPTEISVEEIENYLKNTLSSLGSSNDSKNTSELINMDKIVVHGVHQFSPLMLRGIEEISKSKKVIFLINYQDDFQSVYQTWIDIYSAFDCEFYYLNTPEFKPIQSSFESCDGDLLAYNLGKIIDGKKESVQKKKNYKIFEFDNMMEFANYVAKLFEEAIQKNPDHPMSYMSEQIYAADSSVNDILKVYFPDQFGERQFLNYPLGHFFLAIANMWDCENNEIKINDMNDIRECLMSGIIAGDRNGRLISIFKKIETVFLNITSIKDMLHRIKTIVKNKKLISDDEIREHLEHISYYSVSIDDLKALESALIDIEELAIYFYEDFEHGSNNFQEFYKKIKTYLRDEIQIDKELSAKFADIISRVLMRLEKVENMNASASLECLKSTMSIYLSQESKDSNKANWIVHDFEQIDGDVLRTKENRNNNILHFACLTDEDITSVNKVEFPWPLTSSFFEVAQNLVDWKKQVYVKSRKEYRNFKRYALIYGLEFNYSKYKLSFVKRNGDQEREPYYLLKVLGVDVERNICRRIIHKQESTTPIHINNKELYLYNQYDYYRFKICKKRFLLESLLENNTIYKDNFLLGKYFEIWLENKTKESLQGMPGSEIILTEKINEIYDELIKFFPFLDFANKLDIIKNVKNRLNTGKGFPILTNENKNLMILRELFIYHQSKDNNIFKQNMVKNKFISVSQEKINIELNDVVLDHEQFISNVKSWCKYCANREICLEYYSYI